MSVTEALERHWREAFGKETLPRRDALARAVAGVLPIDGDPLRDPLFLPADVAERRESIMQQMATYEDSSMPCGFNDHDIKDGDHIYRADEYKVWQHRTAYDLLSRGVDVRTIAAMIHREPAWVDEVAREFNLA
jgi:hypothetical protein